MPVSLVIMGMIVRVVVLVPIKRKRPLRASAEQGPVFRRCGHMFRRTFAADVPVQAYDAVRGSHDDVKRMAHHHDSDTQLAPYILDLSLERCRTGLVEPLCSLIQEQEVRCVKDCARQKNSLQLTSG